MAADNKKLLIEYNKLRDTKCLPEGKSEVSWLRPQRRHFPQSNRSSVEKVRDDEEKCETDRTSWITIAPPHHKERRHFPERNNAIFG
ncbi:spermatogenesis-associated protein 45 [Sphaerodactylus townsendi]|uniref:spermatogenesis-associated protein 45 n=1 Tax=Sphaerodactylus townsendi TaxID=933632 RepID=UPI0020260A06|nr:spermatogenesis-associated protein 45 [Sphaerodactylus townsendi]